MINYLSLDGLTTLVNKCKSYFVPQTRTVNGKALSSDIEIGASDINLLVDGKIPSDYLPSYVDDVLEYAGTANFPTTGETGKIYVDTSTNSTYRWSGSTYVEIGSGDSDYTLPAATTTTLGGVMVNTDEELETAISYIDDNIIGVLHDDSLVIDSSTNQLGIDTSRDWYKKLSTLSRLTYIASVTTDATAAYINEQAKSYDTSSSSWGNISSTKVYTSTTIPAATTTSAGVMTAEDKTKLDNLSESGVADMAAITDDEITALFD